MKVFGLTGGIGCGKSAVARRFLARGLPTADADDFARWVVAPGTEGLEEVVASFGPEVAPGGELDRKRLARVVFQDTGALARLESIVHPRVREAADAFFNEMGLRGHQLGCYVVPVLFEKGMQDRLRPVVVVTCSEDQQVGRACLRDASSPESVRSRMAAQMPLSEKVARAGYVIENDGTLDQLNARCDLVLDRLCGDLGLPPLPPATYGVP